MRGEGGTEREREKESSIHFHSFGKVSNVSAVGKRQS